MADTPTTTDDQSDSDNHTDDAPVDATESDSAADEAGDDEHDSGVENDPATDGSDETDAQATPSTSTGTQLSNPEFVASAFEKETQQAQDDFASAQQHAATQSWLERKLDARQKPVDVMGDDFNFRPIGTGRSMEIIERSQDLGEDENVGDMPDLFRDICVLLGEHCIAPVDETDSDGYELPPTLSAAEFAGMPPGDVQEAFMEIVGDLDDEDRERIEEFRGE